MLFRSLGLVPRVVQERYRTIFMQEEDVDSLVAESAVGSTSLRVVHLKDSLMLTARHPLLGSGPGLFPVVSVDVEKSRGLRPTWQQTHNAYTQVSSECGVPAFFFFVGLLVWIFRTVSRVGKAARAAGNQDVRNLAFCLKLMLAAVAVNSLFDSIAYQYYLPILAGLTLSLDTSTRSMLARAAAPAPADASADAQGGWPGRLPGRGFASFPAPAGRPGTALSQRESARRSL